LTIGFGNLIGGLVAGRLSDWTLLHYSKANVPTDPAISPKPSQELSPIETDDLEKSLKMREDDKTTRPEDRLRTMWIGGVILFPGALIGAGWLMETG
jgi:hypothetical protein